MLKRIIVILVVLACAAGGIWWLYDGKRQPSDLLTLYGNVDIRQVDVGFRVGGRVTELFKEEGDAVKTGERLARLDAKPYEEVFDQAAAQLSMQEIELRKMVAGYRTEDIEQARATLSGAQAVYANAASNLRRVERLRQQNAVSQQSLDEARASYGDALSRRNAAREQLQLMESGYRSEDVERQKAAVEAARAELARATTNLLAGGGLQLPDRAVRPAGRRGPDTRARDRRGGAGRADRLHRDAEQSRVDTGLCHAAEPWEHPARPGGAPVHRRHAGQNVSGTHRLYFTDRRIHAEDRGNQGSAE